MKNISSLSFCGLAAALLFMGCATDNQVASTSPARDRRVYDAPFDQVWHATVDASQRSDLDITSADRTTGYIAARRVIRPNTFGENIDIWVRNLGPAQTEVEVFSREAGPSTSWLRTWESDLHRAIAANLTREVPAVGTAPGQTIIERGDSTVVIPPGSRQTVVVQPSPVYAPSEQQRRVDALRSEILDRQTALSAQTDPARRDAIERELDRLNADLRLEELKLR